MAQGVRMRWGPAVWVLAVAALGLTACTTTVTGAYMPAVSPNAALAVVGDSGGPFDQTVKNALDDVSAFWRTAYPSVSGGKALPGLTGRLYSVDAAHPSPAARQNGCIRRAGVNAVLDNAFYCQLDDSIAWDRNAQHLVPVLGASYGPLLVAMVFAHEFGHAVQARLGLFKNNVASIVHESQADCAAGAFTASVLRNQALHLRAAPADLDRALTGYLNVRDDTPTEQQQISHGDGFDRIGALADGVEHGVTECYKPTWPERSFTERPWAPGEHQLTNGGNEPLAQILDGTGGLQPDLNQYWAAQFTRIGKRWTNVKTAVADHPACADTRSAFGYRPADNTAYTSHTFAQQAYYSLSALSIDPHTGAVTIVDNQPADFALGTLFAYGWAFAVQHQLHPDRSLTASLVVVALMLKAATGLLRESGRVLLEAAPEGIDLHEIRAHLLDSDHVRDVHDLHVWTVTSALPTLSAHVVIDEECFTGNHTPALLDQLQACLVGHFDVEHCTFQLEPAGHASHEEGTHP